MAGNDRYRGIGLRFPALALILLIPAFAAGKTGPGPSDKPMGSDPSLPSPDSLALRIAARYGADGFNKVNSIHYKFNVLYKGNEIVREWTWFPKQDSVNYRGKDAKGLMMTAAYSRRNTFSMGAEHVAGIDKSFINDQYWLLFPLHLKWDKDLQLQVAPGKMPGEAYKLTVMYPPGGGYTPGDAYDLFVDSAGTIKRWHFRKANAAKPTNEAMWSAPVMIGGIGFSLEHPGQTKDFKLWFTEVKVDSDPS